MRKFILNIFILLGIAGLGVLAAWIVKNSCAKHSGLSPEDTVKSFYTSLLSGEWDKARSLCADTDDMESYCHTFRQFWEKSMKKDSVLLATAAGVLEESDMSLSDGRHEGKVTFSTLFTITTDSGASKTRIVQLKKEDGIWLVTMIQDAGQGLPVRN